MRTILTPDKVRIIKMRLDRAWSQEQLAEISMISTRSIQHLGAGNSSSLEMLRSLASAFEVHFKDLLNMVMYVALLYESPFTDLTPQGPEGLFSSAQVDKMIAVLDHALMATQNPPPVATSKSPT